MPSNIFSRLRGLTEPPVSAHPNYRDWVVAYGRWSFTRIEPQESLPRRGPGTSTLWKVILCMQVRICVVPFCHLSSSYMLNNKANIARDQRMRQVVAYKRLEKNGKSLTVRPKKWSRSLTGDGRLLEVPTVRLWLAKFWCFGLAIAYERWSHVEVRLYLLSIIL